MDFHKKMILSLSWFLLVDFSSSNYQNVVAGFSSHTVPSFRRKQQKSHRSLSLMNAAPKRLEENVDGPLYVNDKCINCSACNQFAPTIFSRRQQPKYGAHIVHQQPANVHDIEDARAALIACPVAAIRVESKAQRNQRGLAPPTPEEEDLISKLAINSKLNGLDPPFPRPISPSLVGDESVYFVGHLNEKSFGAVPFLVSTRTSSSSSSTGKLSWVLVDSPRYSKAAVEAVEKVTGPEGPDYLMLSHVDDTAGHEDWKEHYPNLKRIFHSGDLGRHNWIGDTSLERVEILLHEKTMDNVDAPLQMFTIDGKQISEDDDDFDMHDMLVVHTPGHSPGSISLWRKPTASSPGIIFTGDTYAHTTNFGGRMTGFPRYGNNSKQQARTLPKLISMLDWQIVAPGHGHVRDYTTTTTSSNDKSDSLEIKDLQQKEMEDAIKELEEW